MFFAVSSLLDFECFAQITLFVGLTDVIVVGEPNAAARLAGSVFTRTLLPHCAPAMVAAEKVDTLVEAHVG